MKQTQAMISTYTADVSGVCSALYELGGMTVMHDASGCNSTYNTHDEPRWYDYDSYVFISALTEVEAIMGDDEKLIGDIVDAADQLHPDFVAIAGTPIPMLTGCDLPAIAAQVEARTGIPSFGFQTNGMHSYILGAGDALAAYARRMEPSGGPKRKGTVNILGATPLDFSVNGSVETIKKLLSDAGWEVIGCWAMGSSPSDLQRAGEAEVNLVISSVGLKTAEVLREKYRTPYVIGTPFGKAFSGRILDELALCRKRGEGMGSGEESIRRAFDFYVPREKDIVIIGESVMSRSLAAAISLEYDRSVSVLCPVETAEGILSKGDLTFGDTQSIGGMICPEIAETELSAALSDAKVVIADPLYEPIVPKEAAFYRLPHEAFSGRLYRKEIPNLIGRLSI